MFSKMFDLDQAMKPALEMTNINSAAAEQLVRHQADYLNSVISSSVTFAKNSVEVKDIKAAADLQKDYVSELNQTLLGTARANLQLGIETRDALVKILEGVIAGLQPKAA